MLIGGEAEGGDRDVIAEGVLEHTDSPLRLVEKPVVAT